MNAERIRMLRLLEHIRRPLYIVQLALRVYVQNTSKNFHVKPYLNLRQENFASSHQQIQRTYYRRGIFSNSNSGGNMTEVA
jgi:hypothetical protein